MRILILTSKDHLYGNVVLKRVLESMQTTEDIVHVFEQDSIIPGKGSLEGLAVYCKKSGVRYVFVQAMKMYLFLFIRTLTSLLKHTTSPFYPYWKGRTLTRETFNSLKTKEALEKVKQINPDIILSVLSKEIIPEEVASLPQHGCYNLHPALLPEYRGISPTFWVLAEKQTQTGCTLHTVAPAIDTGAIVDQQKLSLNDIQTEHAIYMQCATSGADMLITLIKNIRDGNVPKGSAQRGEGSYRSLPTKEAIAKFYANGYSFFTVKEFFIAS